ncbi:MAG: phosphoribosylglycinamide formyltransferase [Treponema sp.]|nr:phosphoribosylglycinamide formyltransferase [Treponema sp.]
MSRLKTAVLVSGGGTNLQALIDFQTEKGESCPYEIVCVISDTKKAYALERASNAGIPSAVCSPFAVMGEEKAKASDRDTKRLAVSNAVLEKCRDFKVQAIVQAGWLTVLCGDILREYEGKIINLHPALLPKFGGVGMWGHHVHEAVLASGEKESGCTIHLVSAECDGGKILIQKKVPVLPGDTPDSLYERIAPEEHKAIVEGTCLLAESAE